MERELKPLDRYGSELRLLWWDLGAESSGELLARVQVSTDDLLRSATLAALFQYDPERLFFHNPRNVLLRRNHRYYLAQQVWVQPSEVAPLVVGSGYANPWFELLTSEPSAYLNAAFGVSVGASAAALTNLEKIVKGIRSMSALPSDFRRDRSLARAEVAENLLREGVAIAELADLHDVVPDSFDPRQLPARFEEVPGATWSRKARLDGPVPSVSDDLDPVEALGTLAADHLVRAAMEILQLADRIGQSPEFERVEDPQFLQALQDIRDAQERLFPFFE